MNDYPEKTCTIDRMVRSERLVQASLDGKKTEQRRGGVYAYPGEEFELKGVRFRITGLNRENLGQMTDQGAQAEGFPDLASYKELILRMHPNMAWNPEDLVWVHSYERVLDD